MNGPSRLKDWLPEVGWELNLQFLHHSQPCDFSGSIVWATDVTSSYLCSKKCIQHVRIIQFLFLALLLWEHWISFLLFLTINLKFPITLNKMTLNKWYFLKGDIINNIDLVNLWFTKDYSIQFRLFLSVFTFTSTAWKVSSRYCFTSTSLLYRSSFVLKCSLIFSCNILVFLLFSSSCFKVNLQNLKLFLENHEVFHCCNNFRSLFTMFKIVNLVNLGGIQYNGHCFKTEG